jgi:hypothetical protein
MPSCSLDSLAFWKRSPFKSASATAATAMGTVVAGQSSERDLAGGRIHRQHHFSPVGIAVFEPDRQYAGELLDLGTVVFCKHLESICQHVEPVPRLHLGTIGQFSVRGTPVGQLWVGQLDLSDGEHAIQQHEPLLGLAV